MSRAETYSDLYHKENYDEGFYGADFYVNEQTGESVDYVDVGYDWAEIRANCTLFTQLVQKVSGTQEMISSGRKFWFHGFFDRRPSVNDSFNT